MKTIGQSNIQSIKMLSQFHNLLLTQNGFECNGDDVWAQPTAASCPHLDLLPADAPLLTYIKGLWNNESIVSYVIIILL